MFDRDGVWEPAATTSPVSPFPLTDESIQNEVTFQAFSVETIREIGTVDEKLQVVDLSSKTNERDESLQQSDGARAKRKMSPLHQNCA